ncbi:MAG: 4-oxalocrotonate tautomerase family protein [Candidatus Cloacimonadota bacterium]|nr:4-oxalocrotonate tautomerase family protein [Candidatus Cloacimonadota bacterium]
MPYINLKTLGKLTEYQKSEISKQFTETLEKVANKSKNSVYIVIDEVERENWAVGGKLFSEK